MGLQSCQEDGLAQGIWLWKCCDLPVCARLFKVEGTHLWLSTLQEVVLLPWEPSMEACLAGT